MSNIPYWKHPTTILVLDDSRSFLKSMKLFLPSTNHSFIFVTNPHTALKYASVSDQQVKQELLQSKPKNHNESEFNAVIDKARQSKRTQEISTIIVDFHMPAMNGLEFCERLAGTLCQKILLTANTEERIAINAFNEGLIDQYICKQNPKVDSLLNTTIVRAEEKYFANKFDSLMPPIFQKECFFSSEIFHRFINKIHGSKKIAESYLIDSYGSIFTVDESRNQKQIFIKKRDDIHVPLMCQQAEELPQEILDQLQKCQKMLCLPNHIDSSRDEQTWLPHLLGTIPILEKEDYFAAISINNLPPYSPPNISSKFVLN